MNTGYDALLLLSFGGPEGPDDVLPFLENVVRGRGVPRERLLEVAEHYTHFGGVSPINDQNRALLKAIRAELDLPVYWGNRNWHPLVEDTVATMRADGVRRALVFVTSAYTSYSGCRQYQDDLARARAAAGTGAPELDKLRHYFNHPGFVEPAADGVRAALAGRPDARLVFTAHSIPASMEASSGPCGHLYTAQLREASRLVTEAVRGPAPSSTWSGSRGPGRRRCRGWSRTSTTTSARWPPPAWAGRRVADRLRLRPRRGALGPGPGSGRDRGRARPRLRPGGDRGHRPALRPDGPPAGGGAYGRRTEARVGADGAEPRRLPAGLLPRSAPASLTEPRPSIPDRPYGTVGEFVSGAGRGRRCRRPAGPGGRPSQVDGARRRGRGPRRR